MYLEMAEAEGVEPPERRERPSVFKTGPRAK